jgi:single-strand DNA-binding protein
MNSVHLLGRIVKDFELKSVGLKNTENCNFTIAVDRKYKNANGEKLSDFFNVVCWGSTAKFANSYFGKGSRILIIGSLQSRSYDGTDGKKVYVTEVNADEVEFVDKRSDDITRTQPSTQSFNPSDISDGASTQDLPFDL